MWATAIEVEARRENRITDSQAIGFDLHEYLLKNRHHEGCPAYLTPRMLDVLMRYAPGSLGLGMDVKHIAVDLKISRQYVHRVLKEFADRFPTVMKTLDHMRNVMFRQGDMMYQHMRSLEGLVSSVGEDGLEEELVEVL